MFENVYTMNKKLIGEYVNRSFCNKLLIIGLPIALLAFLEALLIRSKEGLFFMMALGIFMLVYPFIIKIIMVRKFEKSSKLLGNGKIEQTQVLFNNDNIVLNEGKVHLEFDYSQMKKVIQSKNFIIIKTKAGTYLLVHKDGFVKGNKVGFLEFIKKKIEKKYKIYY